MTMRSVMLLAALMVGATDGMSRTALAQARPSESRPLLNTIQDVGNALGRCWVPPLEKYRPGTQITVLITFNRSGEVIGEPRFTYITPGLPDDIRLAYRLSVADAISRCVPLSFTPGLAGAIAGRPFAMRYDERRGQRGAEKPWQTTTTS